MPDAPSAQKNGSAPMTSSETLEVNLDGPRTSVSTGFDGQYKLKAVLGTGAFSTVREGEHKATKVVYAIKCVTKKNLSEEDRLALLDEVDILKALTCQSIIRLYDFFDEAQFYYLVMENMTGGELFDRIVAKQYYSEQDARDLIATLLKAMDYCHQNKIAHRDLKPENLLLRSMEDDSDVKIADFGFAKRCVGPKCLKTQCGTPGYVAPEILEGFKYDYSADMWSVGVILYILLGGYPPFYEENQNTLFKKIKKGDYEFHPEYWGNVSADAKSLIKSLLTVNPEKRITAAEALKGGWICRDARVLSQVDLGKNLEEFRKYNARRKFKIGVHTIMAANKMKFMQRASVASGGGSSVGSAGSGSESGSLVQRPSDVPATIVEEPN